jgi:hypothetical protein
MTDDVKAAIEELRSAIEDEGRAPEYHRAMMVRHRTEWPTFWRAIDRLLEAQKRVSED